MKSARPRKLHHGHFAFMRAAIQGLDLQSSWHRHLRVEAGHIGEARMRAAIAWMRSEFAAAAQRQSEPGVACLLLMDAQQNGEEMLLLTLEGPSQGAQVNACDEASDDAGKQSAASAHLIARQLEAVRWLEGVAAEAPRAADSVRDWLWPSLARRLEKTDMPTLFALVERINAQGLDWWRDVAGVGKGKAGRILEWLKLNEVSIGMYVGGQLPASGDSGSVESRSPGLAFDCTGAGGSIFAAP